MDETKNGYLLTGTVCGSPVRAVVPSSGLEIGRSHTCGLSLPDPEVSRLHCVVRADGDTVTVENRSQNGTLVNGVKTEGVTAIKVGDVLGLGSSELKLENGAVPVSASAPTRAPASAPAVEIESAFKPGDMVDRYRISRLIGKGGMGTVYEVVHTGLDLPRALKALTLPDDPSYAAFRQKFLDEGKMLARLKHDNITQVYDAAYDEKTRTLFFVMDLVLYDDGKPCTLADVAYDECDVSAWFASLASALDYVHRQGIVHSDIKLQNVLVSAGQKIKLADFGVAHLLSGKMRASLHGGEKPGEKETIGYTAHYVAPEILKDDALPSAASDVYALGVMLVKLLANKWYDECPSALAEIAAKRSLNWRPVLTQMLSADPKRRVTDLARLVNELRKGSKAPVRQRYLIESRRRRNQKIRLQRIPSKMTERLVPTAFASEPRWKKIARWSALGALALSAVIGLAWMQSVNSAKAAEEQKRFVALQDAREEALLKLQGTRKSFADRADAIKGEIERHRQEFAFVGNLSRANVTGSVDRVRSERRNEVLLRYADVLKAIAGIRKACADFNQDSKSFEERFQACDERAAVQTAVAEFDVRRRATSEALEAGAADEGAKWTAYLDARERMSGERLLRTQLGESRRRALEAVRAALESEPDLKTAPELAAAKAAVEKADGLVKAGTAGCEDIAALYAEVEAALTNGCDRLQRQRLELAGIEESFHRADDDVRKVLLARLRSGQIPLKAAVIHVRGVSERFAEKWKTECQFELHRGLLDEYAFCLQAQAAYLDYMLKHLSGPRDNLTLAVTASGVDVSTSRYTYVFRWEDILSDRRLGTRSEEKYRKMIQEIIGIPLDRKAGVGLLAGRWIAMRELRPVANADEQEERLVEAIRASDNAAVLAWARRELPEKFPPPEAPAAPAPALSFAEFPQDLPRAASDDTLEKLVFFDPGAGLTVPAFGSDVGLSKCVRVKDSTKVRFQILNGEAFLDAVGAGRPFADIEEGQSFDVRYEAVPGLFRYGLLSWIDGAWSDGRTLVLIRCQKISDSQSDD